MFSSTTSTTTRGGNGAICRSYSSGPPDDCPYTTTRFISDKNGVAWQNRRASPCHGSVAISAMSACSRRL